jgi:hypothetical protein
MPFSPNIFVAVEKRGIKVYVGDENTWDEGLRKHKDNTSDKWHPIEKWRSRGLRKYEDNSSDKWHPKEEYGSCADFVLTW